MKFIIQLTITGLLVAGGGTAVADTESEVRARIMESNQYVKKNLKVSPNSYSKKGAVEFWSSGGMMQMVEGGGRDDGFDSFNIDVKHIHVTTLVPNQVAIAHYYSEGTFKPRGFPVVNNYRTRVSQVFVKEDDEWRVRSSHWSPMSGGAGTSQTASTE